MKHLFICSLIFLSAVSLQAQNVGIGITTPVAYGKLHVHDGFSSQDASIVLTNTLTGTDPLRGARFRMHNSDLYIMNNETAGNLGLSTNFNTRLLIDASGNVGIGTLTPGTKLHVFDQDNPLAGKIETVNGGFAGLEIKAGGTNNNYFRIIKNSTGIDNSTLLTTGTDAGGMRISTGANEPIIVETQNLVRMRVQGDGNIAVGNIVATEKLQVDGNIKLGNALIANNSAGTPGQVLRSNGPGNPASWGDACFTRMEDFYYEDNGSPYQTWIVPVGVTKIKVNMWSGGGNSSAGDLFTMFSGGSGAYANFLMNVSPGQTINIHTGGGTNSNTSAALADSSVVRNSATNDFCRLSGAYFIAGVTYGGTLISSSIPVFWIEGTKGQKNSVGLTYNGTTGFQHFIGAAGGDAPFGGKGGNGGGLIRDIPTLTNYDSFDGGRGSFPGGGNGGLYTTLQGANGLVIIYY